MLDLDFDEQDLPEGVEASFLTSKSFSSNAWHTTPVASVSSLSSRIQTWLPTYYPSSSPIVLTT